MLIRRLFGRIGAAVVLPALIVGGPVFADDDTARGGTLACGGTQAVNGSTTYTFRNHNDDGTITIERLRALDAHGAVLFDSDASGLPPTLNGVSASLAPHQAALYSTDTFLALLPLSQLPITLLVDWSADKRAITLGGASVLTFFATATVVDPATGLPVLVRGEARSRIVALCRGIATRRGR